MEKRLCIIGLDLSIVNRIRKAYFGPIIVHSMPPKFIVKEGILYIERANGVGMLKVDKVIFHGIFEHDLDLLTALAIWNGDCYPNALGMLNCRLKLPCLARALQISSFNSKRGLIAPNTTVKVNKTTVGKWGNWHCGENKLKFNDQWTSQEAAIIEPYFEGKAVRVISIGNTHLQIKLEGKTWLKSVHDARAAFMDLDTALLADTLAIKEHFGLQIIANDYIVSESGEKHLLEVNHIPNVTRFDKLQDVYFQDVLQWLND